MVAQSACGGTVGVAPAAEAVSNGWSVCPPACVDAETYMVVRRQAFTAAELATFVRTGVQMSFLPETEKAALRARIDVALADVAHRAGVDLARDGQDHVGPSTRR